MLNDTTSADQNDHIEAPKARPARHLIGYVRVSTTRQGRNGISLEHQRDMLAFYTSERRYVLEHVYEDQESGRRTAQQRKGLRQALDHARRDALPLVVASLDRLARNVDVVEEVLISGVTVHSADKGRITKAAMAAIVRRAQEECNEIARLNRLSVAKRKAQGEKIGDVRNFRGKEVEGTKQNQLRRDQNVNEIIDFLSTHPAAQDLSPAQTAKVLNTAGVLNLVSLKRDERSFWTEGSLRRKLKRAKKELQVRSASSSGITPPD